MADTFDFYKVKLEKGIKDIYAAQLNIAKYRIYNNATDNEHYRGKMGAVKGTTGNLFRALENPKYSIEPSGEGIQFTNNLPLYIRFLDMVEHGNFAIYNRQIYGILYNEVLTNLKWDYRTMIIDKITKQFNDTFVADIPQN